MIHEGVACCGCHATPRVTDGSAGGLCLKIITGTGGVFKPVHCMFSSVFNVQFRYLQSVSSGRNLAGRAELNVI